MFETALLSLANEIISLARDKHIRMVTAESCTGGLIGAVFTEIAGSSDVMEGGFITYSNQLKQQSLGVSKNSLEQFGAVSAKVAGEMAEGALAHSSMANLAIAVTGVAGPGQSEAKPAGLVFIALAYKDMEKPKLQTSVTEFNFKGLDRSGVRLETVKQALLMIKSRLIS